MSDNNATEVVEAFADYTEISASLRAKLDEYDGYSPSYAFSYDIQRRAEAEARVEAALEAFVLQVIARAGVSRGE